MPTISIAFALFIAFATSLVAQEKPLPRENFKVAGRDAFVMLPKKVDDKSSMPWVWYAPTLKSIPDGGETWMFEKFLTAGIAIAGVNVGESYGSPAGRKGFTALYDELTGKRNFAKKAILLPRSRGGLMLYCWAAENPECVRAIAGIYPVCDLRSYPGLEKASKAYGLTRDELVKELDKHNPVARLESLAKAKVPIFHIHGDKDMTVPLKENSAALAENYKALGGTMTLKVIEGQGHNREDVFLKSQPIVDFVLEQAKALR